MNVGIKILVAAEAVLLGGAQTGQAQSAQALQVADPVVVNSPEPGIAHFFGRAVAIEGDHVLIGAPGVPLDELDRVRDAGAAYLFDTAGHLVCKFEKDVPEQRDAFGGSVALSVEYVLIGALGDDISGTDAGAAYLFSRDTCELMKVFKNPDPQRGDLFGFSVSISGNNVLIGDVGDDTDGVDWGGAYLFDASPSLLAPNDLKARLANPAQVGGGRYGFSVSVSGTNALIGAPNHDSSGIDRSGAAYLYEIDPPAPVLVETFHNSTPREQVRFGRSVALSEDRALIGSSASNPPGSAHLFSLTDFSEVVPPLVSPHGVPGTHGGAWFGREVALAGNHLLVGGNNSSNTGWSSFLFDASDGSHVHTFSDPESDSTDFGFAVATSPRYVVIGNQFSSAVALLAGTVYIYALSTP